MRLTEGQVLSLFVIGFGAVGYAIPRVNWLKRLQENGLNGAYDIVPGVRPRIRHPKFSNHNSKARCDN